MDDVTSGFNIGDNVSLFPNFNGVMGFTETDVIKILDHYFTEEDFKIDKEEALAVMKKWYDNYKFARGVSETVFNTDAVWYFIRRTMAFKNISDDLIDVNLRADYRKLRYLLIQDRQLNGNFNKLTEIINNGGIVSNIKSSFPFDMIAQYDNFISLMLYFGLLTFSGYEVRGMPYLKIPNETIKNLVFSYIESALQIAYDFNMDMSKFRDMLDDMAFNGNFKPLFAYIAKNINDNTGLRDYINAQDNEHTVKIMYLKDLCLYDLFITESEKELNKGFADLWLVPFNEKYRHSAFIPFAYLIEFKYIKRDVAGKELETTIQKMVTEATEQLAKYSDDENAKRINGLKPHGQVTLKKLIIVFHGWELSYCEECEVRSKE
jgi:hypothetical protein